MEFIPDMQEWFNIQKTDQCNTPLKWNEGKNHMIISTNAEKAFDKIKHSTN